jgi:hypothetical protein
MSFVPVSKCKNSKINKMSLCYFSQENVNATKHDKTQEILTYLFCIYFILFSKFWL